MRPTRRGSIYVIVLATSLMVFVLAFGAIAWAQTQSRASVPARDEIAARRLAASAVELALQSAQNTVAWRTRAAAGDLFTDLSTGDGYVTARASDSTDANLVNNTSDPVVFTGVGRVGRARQVFRVSASARPVYCSALDGALHGEGNLTITSAIVRASAAIGSGSNVLLSSATVKSDVYAVGTVSGSTITGTTTTGVTARAMPDADLIAQYAADATALSYGTLGGRIWRCVLSGYTNPYGAVNARGLYAVNCGGGSLDIEDCRITGTLIITNTSGVRVRNSVYMSPWEPGIPVLLISGPLDIQTVAMDLIEASFQNFNPAGNPYNGVTDSDTADRYPSILQGIVYASGAITLSGNVSVVGCLVGASTISVQPDATVVLTRQVTGSPPAFVTRHFLVDSTTWARSVD